MRQRRASPEPQRRRGDGPRALMTLAAALALGCSSSARRIHDEARSRPAPLQATPDVSPAPHALVAEIPDGNAFGGTVYGAYRFAWGTDGWPELPDRGHARDYRGTTVVRRGAIDGRVLWPEPPHTTAELPASDPECAPSVPNHSLHVDEHGNAGGVVVYLEGIAQGRRGMMEPALHLRAMQLGGLVRMQGCGFVPRVQVVSPVGAVVHLANDSATPRTWRGTLPGHPGLFRATIAPAAVERATLGHPGIVHVHDDRAQASAWLVVAGHPYHTITDDQGRFSLVDVPPGTYTLVAWHPPVAQLDAAGRTTLSAPFVHRSRITVAHGASRRVTLRLPAGR